MNDRFFRACFSVLGHKKWAGRTADYSAILQQPLIHAFHSILLQEKSVALYNAFQIRGVVEIL